MHDNHGCFRSLSKRIGFLLISFFSMPSHAEMNAQSIRTGSSIVVYPSGSFSLTSRPSGGLVVAGKGGRDLWGLVDGDLLERVDSYPVYVPEDAFAIIRAANRAHVLALQVERGESRITVRVGTAKLQMFLPPAPPAPPPLSDEAAEADFAPPAPPIPPVR